MDQNILQIHAVHLTGNSIADLLSRAPENSGMNIENMVDSLRCLLGIFSWDVFGVNKSHGDWKSQAYMLYLQFSMEDKLQVSEIMFTTT